MKRSRGIVAGVLAVWALTGVLETTHAQPSSAASAELASGIRQTQSGEFASAVVTLDGAARRLAAAGGHAKELARAYLYLAVAYLGLNHIETARATFLEAWQADRDLRIDTGEFAPGIVRTFESVRQEALQSASARPEPAASPLPAQAAAVHQRSKALPILLGAGAAGAVAVAVAGSGSGAAAAAPSTTPTTSVTTAPSTTLATSQNPTVGTITLLGLNPPSGSTVQFSIRGVLIEATAQLTYGSSGTYRMCTAAGPSPACIGGCSEPFELVAGQPRSVTAPLYFITNERPSCPDFPFTTDSVLLAISEVSYRDLVRVYVPGAYTFVVR